MAQKKKEEAKAPVAANRTNAILAWVFAPLTSFIFMNDEDEFTKRCAKHSMYFGVIDVVLQVVLWIGGAVLSIFIVGICCWVVAGIWAMVSLAVRIMGAVKANNGELFEVPVIKDMVKE